MNIKLENKIMSLILNWSNLVAKKSSEFSTDGKRWDPSSDFNFDRKIHDHFKIELNNYQNRIDGIMQIMV